MEQVERPFIQRKFREAFPREKIEPLIDHLRSTPKRDVKAFILKFLGWSADERALPVLLEYLQEPDSAEVAAQGLIDFGPAAMPAVLQTLVNADEDEIVALLLRVVNALGASEAIPNIIPFLDHDNPMIRRLAIETLGQIPAAIDYLLAKLDDADVPSQQAAMNSITALVEALPAIKERRALEDPTAAAVALGAG